MEHFQIINKLHLFHVYLNNVVLFGVHATSRQEKNFVPKFTKIKNWQKKMATKKPAQFSTKDAVHFFSFLCHLWQIWNIFSFFSNSQQSFLKKTSSWNNNWMSCQLSTISFWKKHQRCPHMTVMMFSEKWSGCVQRICNWNAKSKSWQKLQTPESNYYLRLKTLQMNWKIWFASTPKMEH